MSEREIFTAARDIADPAARAAYLDTACAGDGGLRARVEALLRADARPDSLLDVPAVAPPEPGSAPTRAFRARGGGAPGDGPTRTHREGADGDTDDALDFLAPAGRPDALGRVGHYEVLEVLGRGGFGVVYRAFDDVLRRVVAVKVLAPSLAATSPARKRFLREARSAALIQHENVVRVFETGEEPLPYLVMEFVPGETLQDRLDRTGPLEAPEALAIARQVAAGLAAAHEKGLIHRDIKPSNILIAGGPQQQVKITDFGLARAADDASLTRSGAVAGTPMYMAPEQAKGEALDHRADLFGLGSVMYAMLTGRPPFRAETTLAVLKRVAEDAARPIREVIPEVPEWLCRVVERLHAKNPADRYQTAREVADVLADCEAQLKAHGGLRDYSRIPGGKPTTPQWTLPGPVVAAAALLLPWPVFLLFKIEQSSPAVLFSAVAGVLISVVAVGVSQYLGRPGEAGTPAPRRSRVPVWAVLVCAAAGTLAAAAVLGLPDLDDMGLFLVAPPLAAALFSLIPARYSGARVADARSLPVPAGRRKWWWAVAALLGLELLAGAGVLLWEYVYIGAVTVRYPEGGAAYLDKPDGRYEIASQSTHRLRPGRYTLTYERSGEQLYRQEIVVGIGEHKGIDIPRGTVRFELEDPSTEITMAGIDWSPKPGTDPRVRERTVEMGRHPYTLRFPGDPGIYSGRRVVVRSDTPTVIRIPAATPGPDGFVSLFNGKDLTGWHTGERSPGRWRVDGGVLVGDDGPGFLFSDGEYYHDFHLRIEARVNAGGNAGVHFLDSRRAEISGKPETPSGSVVRLADKKAVSFTPYPHGIAPADTWFTMEIRAGGPKVEVRVNDLPWTTAAANHGFRPHRIHLEAAAGTVVEFKRIEVKRVSPRPAAPPPAVAPFDAAKAKEHQEAWAEYLGVPVEFENAVGMKFRLIPPGEFTMGSNPKEVEAVLNDQEFKRRPGAQGGVRGEGPVRRVLVAEPFLMGAHEVTVGQFGQFAAAKKYKTFAEKNGGGLAWDPKSEAWSQSPSHVWNDAEFGGGESYPVRFVTLPDARAFCAWLGEQDGLRYVVPTEEQWEFACRAGTTTPWSFGDDPAAMERHGWTKPHAGGGHHPVGRLAANPFGLFDLHGNARELALDARGGPVERGGGEDSSALWARSAVRMPFENPNGATQQRGFRVAVVGDLSPKVVPAPRAKP